MSQVEGRNPVIEALRRGGVTRIILVEGAEGAPKIQEITRLAKEMKVHVEFVERAHLDDISETERHQGVVAFMEPPRYASLDEVLSKEEGDVCLLLLDRVQDPRNFGAILRTADATGVDAVVIPERGSVGITSTVIRTAMGGAVHVPVVRGSLFRVVKRLRDEGVKIVGIDPDGTVEYYDERLTGSIAFVLGGEGRGISQQLLGKCDGVVRIPMIGHITSLNVGVSAAVVLYERLRQQVKTRPS
ncbi:MAG: 23S rRNA (guanosine(2251)-2'-O)-methyltransferase RlmB [Candidatus Bathyarchaeota archaeon]|nr:MAG: 23S rRNA (guanosine(2251)-2'-O)-methyltransferase RlmB [Candidatus Bathyarchaeota archaeon]